MPVVHILLRQEAVPSELTSLGAALWQWCIRAAASCGIYHYLDNQALIDLLDGRFPAFDSRKPASEQIGFRFGVRDGAFATGRNLSESLWLSIPSATVRKILIDGVSYPPKPGR